MSKASRVDDRVRQTLEVAIAAERRRTIRQIADLERSFAGIVDAAELTSTDDEHDPEGATIAYERAQVWALLEQARADLGSLDLAGDRLRDGSILTCTVCGQPIAVERVLALPGVTTCVRCA
jgi:DnaK suppressor protein